MRNRSLHGNRIVLFGLSNREIGKIKKCVHRDDINVYIADCATDIIANDSLAVIINNSSLSTEEREMLLAYYDEIEVFAETVILLGSKTCLSKNTRIKCFDSFTGIEKYIEYILLNTFAKKQKAENFSRSLSYALSILKMITEKPGITTKEISAKLEITPRSVTRYIETLNVAGESIVYNHKCKGWKLQFDESLLELSV